MVRLALSTDAGVILFKGELLRFDYGFSKTTMKQNHMENHFLCGCLVAFLILHSSFKPTEAFKDNLLIKIMGKKDGKRADQVKIDAKKARQSAKQNKVATKRTKKECAASGEVDLEQLILDISLKEKARTSVVITPCAQPSPRSNFSMTSLPNGEMLMFGGEYCDGEITIVYNDLFRWNVEKNGGEWKRIESINTPPPRCSHQMVYFKEKVYLFGGEYATLDQFHHYRDLWTLEMKTWTWIQHTPSGDVPTAR